MYVAVRACLAVGDLGIMRLVLVAEEEERSHAVEGECVLSRQFCGPRDPADAARVVGSASLPRAVV